MFKIFKDIWSSLDAQERKYLGGGLLSICLIGFTAIFILPIIFTIPAIFGWMDFTNKGSIGDTVNGVAGPFIALLAAILTFLAFYVQYQANVQQRNQFTSAANKQKLDDLEQEKTWKIERFENRFFELLKLHQINVAEINMGYKSIGRKSFVHMFYELRLCYVTIEAIISATSDAEKDKNNYENIKLMNFAYKIFFYGIGAQSEKHYQKKFSKGERHLFISVKKKFEEIQESYEDFRKKNTVIITPYVYNLPLNGIYDDKTVEMFYFPFDGHINTLGHYFRHMFQTVNYVISRDFITEAEKYSYLKTYRAQISNFEQLMIYYNALAWFDKEWKPIFTTYRFIKNIPLELADFDKNPSDQYAMEIEFFRKQHHMEIFESDER